MLDLTQVFATEMRRRREALGLSQEALGVMLGLDRNSVSRVERNAPNLPIANAAAIAEALGTNLAKMLGGTGPAKSESEMRRAFSEHVREMRMQRGFNQREFAERMGVDRNWISAVESGRQNITLRTVEKFAQALGVKAVELL